MTYYSQQSTRGPMGSRDGAARCETIRERPSWRLTTLKDGEKPVSNDPLAYGSDVWPPVGRR
jgi:hypothetical protein